jgi:hypothetical protein
MDQGILGFIMSTAVVVNKTLKWQPIAAIPMQNCITPAAFACSADGRLLIAVTKRFRIVHPSIVSPKSSATVERQSGGQWMTVSDD